MRRLNKKSTTSRYRFISPFLISGLLLAGFLFALPSRSVSADHEPDAGNYGVGCKPDKNKETDCTVKQECHETPLTRENCQILNHIWIAINFLSAMVGIVVALMIILGGIQYSTSRGDPSAVAAAKQRIRNAVLALVIYIFMFSFLQWLVPGGIFR